MLLMKESMLSSKEKTNNTTLILQNYPQVLKTLFMTDLLNIIIDDFGIWLLGYRIKFSCLYIPQGHYLISTLWLWSTDEYVIFLFE